MESTAIEEALTDDLGHDQQTPSLHAIARCPKSLERCLHRLLDLLGAYWEEFRGPGGSTLATVCNSFAAAARVAVRESACLLSSGPAARCCRVESCEPAAVEHADRFIEILDQAIDARERSMDGSVELGADALRLATALVKEIPWGRLSADDAAPAHDMLKWMAKRISSVRKGCSDRNYARLVRRLIRADPTILVDLAKEARRHGRAD